MEEISHRIGPAALDADNSMDCDTEPELSLSPLEKSVLSALEPYPLQIDDLTRKLGLQPSELSSTLLRLELKGLVQQNPGKLFCIKS